MALASAIETRAETSTTAAAALERGKLSFVFFSHLSFRCFSSSSSSTSALSALSAHQGEKESTPVTKAEGFPDRKRRRKN